MALQIWLPLILDLRQQGIANTSTITLASGNVFVNGGKVGNKALHLTKQQTILGTSSCMSGKKQMSYAFWVKVNTAWSAQWLDGIAWYSTDGSSAAYSRQEFYTNCTRIGTWFSGSSLSGYVFTPGEWTHIAGTFDYTTGIAKFYINGILQGTSTSLSKTHYCRGDFYLGDSGVDIVENDIRIYDHCLSPMEVKELAKGLILHYPLNRQGWGQENLVKGSNTNATSTNLWLGHSAVGGNTSTIEQDETGTYCVKVTRDATAQSSWDYLSYDNFLRGEIKTDTTYTVSFDCKPSVSGSISFTGFVNGNATNYMTNSTTTIQGNCTANQWNHMVYQCKTISSFSSITVGSQVVYFSRSASLRGTNVTVLFKNIKVEEGSIATPWCPNSSDALATTMGLNSAIEYDCSGFCNNGTRTGTFAWTSDTPKYAVSTKFASSQIIADALTSEVKTLACWVKTTASKSTSQFVVADSASNMCISFYSGCIIGVFGSTRSTGSKSTLGNSYIENDWNHIVVVKTGDSGERAIYCNGVLLTPASNDYWSVATGFFVSGRNTSNSLPMQGYICDVRAYATALSADDVKSLYQNCATIDPDGTIRGQIRS